MINWNNLDVVEASENTLVVDQTERLNALYKFKHFDSILNYWVISDFNNGNFDTEEELEVDWTGFDEAFLNMEMKRRQ